MPTDNEIKEKALVIIAQYFGQETAKLYKNYYKDKDSNFVEKSLVELLTDIVGIPIATKIIQENIYE